MCGTGSGHVKVKGSLVAYKVVSSVSQINILIKVTFFFLELRVI